MDNDDFLRFMSYTKYEGNFLEIFKWHGELFDAIENKTSDKFIINKIRQAGVSLFFQLYAIYKCMNTSEYSISIIFPRSNMRQQSFSLLRRYITNSEKDKMSYYDGYTIRFINGSSLIFQIGSEHEFLFQNRDLYIVDEADYVNPNFLRNLISNSDNIIMFGTPGHTNSIFYDCFMSDENNRYTINYSE